MLWGANLASPAQTLEVLSVNPELTKSSVETTLYKYELVKSLKALVLKDTYPTVSMQTLPYTFCLHRMHIYNAFTSF